MKILMKILYKGYQNNNDNEFYLLSCFPICELPKVGPIEQLSHAKHVYKLSNLELLQNIPHHLQDIY